MRKAGYALWSSGYPSAFGNDAAEITSIKDGLWSPASKDFQAAANRAGLAAGANSLSSLLTQIGNKKVGSIDTLGIIAHSNSSMISLAGTIITARPAAPDVKFSPSGVIDAKTLKAKAKDIAKVTDRFTRRASIILYSCNAGADLSLVISFQEAFGVDCYGFKAEVHTCTRFNNHGTLITSRGRMAYAPNVSSLVATGLVTPCSFAKNTVWDLHPDTAFFSRT